MLKFKVEGWLEVKNIDDPCKFRTRVIIEDGDDTYTIERCEGRGFGWDIVKVFKEEDIYYITTA